MKQSPNKNQVVALIATPKTKKNSISSKTLAPSKEKAKVSATKSKPTTGKTAEVRSKTQKLEAVVPIRNSKIADSNKKQVSSAQKGKPEIKAINPKASSNVKAEKITAKIPPVVQTKKNQVVKRQKFDDKVEIVKIENKALVKKVSAQISQPRVSVSEKMPKNQKDKQTVSTVKLPTITSTKKAKAVKSETPIEIKKPIKPQPKITSEKVQSKKSGAKPKIANAKSITAIEKISSEKDTANNTNKNQNTPVNVEDKSLNSKLSKIAKVEDQKIVAVHLVKKLKLPKSIIAPKNKKVARQKSAKPIVIKTEEPILTTQKPKKAKAISSAVFRGEKNRYDFTVFPLDAVFENVPAIYIISRRVVDKRKKAHHALVYIGQTESLLDEIKKHKKDKSVKKFAANSISLLREENENRRLKIETDLKAAHAVRCLYT